MTTTSCCELIWAGQHLKIPSTMGKPSQNQMQGTALDSLIELSGRICYDSLGAERSRASKEYHEHVIEVNHLSVAEHANLTFCIPCSTEVEAEAFLSKLINIPGTYSRYEQSTSTVRITMNARVIREMEQYKPTFFTTSASLKQWDTILNTIVYLAKKEFDLFLSDLTYDPYKVDAYGYIANDNKDEEEIWASFWIGNVSRGLTHELVRHKFRTAVSQRSTRYVDESGSQWCYHPLMLSTEVDDNQNMIDRTLTGENEQKDLYSVWVEVLQQSLINKGISKFSARKQARGAARGLLGNALSTELIFSASLAQWKRMIEMRASNAADAEIRRLFVEIFLELKHKYPGHFESYGLSPSNDGCGDCVVKTE